MTVEGIDISHHQASTPSLKGLDFVFARASIGTLKDRMYDAHIGKARDAGLITGAYHFNWDTIPVVDQVKAFLKAAGDVDFYFIDVEGANAFNLAQTKAFIAGVHKAGKKIGLYHSLSGFFEAGQDYNWIAFWSKSPPHLPWTFWQYRGSPLDLDRFIGTRAQLWELAGRLPDTASEKPVRSFSFDSSTRIGSLTHKTDRSDYEYLKLGPNVLAPVSEIQFPKRAIGPVRLTEGIGDNSDARSIGFIIESEAAFVLASQVATFNPDSTGITQADVDEIVEAAVADAIIVDRAKATVQHRIVYP